MLTTLTSLSVVFPVFAVIVAGFACGRLGLLGPTASSELNRFVVYLGLPALLFQVMAEANWPVLWQPGFMASFAIGPGVCVWIALSELMPTRIRSNGMSIALVINQLVSTVLAGIFLPFVSKQDRKSVV